MDSMAPRTLILSTLFLAISRKFGSKWPSQSAGRPVQETHAYKGASFLQNLKILSQNPVVYGQGPAPGVENLVVAHSSYEN